MTLCLRHLRLRAMTPAGLYGTDIPFKPGLNVIWADNTKGKSTCMQGMLYALGLERMLSPRGLPPFGGPGSKLVHRWSRDDGGVSERP